ncbi:MAG: hypothetical protein AAF557_04895 [Pseudomonadota bacterium]
MTETIPVDVGWRVTSPQGALAFIPPEPIDVPGFEGRVLQVLCPYNARVRKTPKNQGPARFGLVPEPGGISQQAFQGLTVPIEPGAQRTTELPAIQISMNLIMICEEDCAIHLSAPFFSPAFRDWPGPLVSGRFPLRSWPRPLNAVLEWQDDGKDWVLRRGEPMAYIWLHFDDPNKVPNVVEAAMTPALKRHFAQVDNVSSFARNVGPMMDEAARRRPARLLTPKRIGCPDFS